MQEVALVFTRHVLSLEFVVCFVCLPVFHLCHPLFILIDRIGCLTALCLCLLMSVLSPLPCRGVGVGVGVGAGVGTAD